MPLVLGLLESRRPICVKRPEVRMRVAPRGLLLIHRHGYNFWTVSICETYGVGATFTGFQSELTVPVMHLSQRDGQSTQSASSGFRTLVQIELFQQPASRGEHNAAVSA